MSRIPLFLHIPFTFLSSWLGGYAGSIVINMTVRFLRGSPVVVRSPVIPLISIFAGSIIGCFCGVYVYDRLSHRNGSLRNAFIGCILGILFSTVAGLRSPILFWTYIFSTPVGATIGFYVPRKKELSEQAL